FRQGQGRQALARNGQGFGQEASALPASVARSRGLGRGPADGRQVINLRDGADRARLATEAIAGAIVPVAAGEMDRNAPSCEASGRLVQPEAAQVVWQQSALGPMPAPLPDAAAPPRAIRPERLTIAVSS